MLKRRSILFLTMIHLIAFRQSRFVRALVVRPMTWPSPGSIITSSSSSTKSLGWRQQNDIRLFSTGQSDADGTGLEISPSNGPTTESSTVTRKDEDGHSQDTQKAFTPWNRPDDHIKSIRRMKKTNNKTRFRQHVNPLASNYQMPTPLSDNWPQDVFVDMSRSLYLDIGCGKGGFLLELAKARPDEYNYLGLEIRPDVAKFAQDRIAKRELTGILDFIGCNANVDLDRLLTRYSERAMQQGSTSVPTLHVVSIQFPDPHFKTQHNKRRVVTPALIECLAKFMPTASTSTSGTSSSGKCGVVFLQSDVKDVFDDMRSKFRSFPQYFTDDIEDDEEYMPENYIGIPTERELSVLKQDLPVYRTVFRRTDQMARPKTV